MENQKNQNEDLAKLRRKVEELLKNKPAQPTRQFLEANDLKLIHELDVHQMELEMQNQELRQAQKEANESAEKYSGLFEFAPIGYFTFSTEGTIIGLNLLGAQMLARERSALINSRFGFFVTNDTKPVFNQFLDTLFKSGKNEFCEVALLKEGALPVFVHLSGIVAKFSNEVLVTAVDITERKLSEAALKESEERYRSLITNLDAGIVVHASDTAIIMNNRRASELLGLSEDQMPGKLAIDPGWKFIGENNIPIPLAEYPVNRIVTTKKPIANITLGVIRPPANDLVWLSVNGFPVCDARGEIREILISFIEITKRKNAEEALRLKNLVFDTSIAANSIADSDANITEVNEAFLKLWGYIDKKELLGKPISDFLADPHETNSIVNALNEKDEWEGDYLALRKNNSTFNAHGAASTLKDLNGNHIGYYSSVIDISKRKLVETMLQQKNEELQKLNIEKDKFFSIIAHDLRSPFNSFLGLTKMIEEELSSFSPDELQSSISSMRKSAGMVFHLLENLLEWSRMQRGLHSFRPESFLLSEQLIANIELVRLASRKKNIRIIQHIPDKLVVTADPQMFQSLMSNLVFNAVKFTPGGGEVTIAAKEMPDHTVVVSVSDNGIGMDKDTLNNLFSINQSNYRKGTEGEPSSGLGLVICKDFVEKHGGKIWAESEEGHGSTFNFSIPYLPEFTPNSFITNIDSSMGSSTRDKKLKILIAEDDETSEMLISIAVKKFSREIFKATNGYDAVTICRNNPDIDLILMDIKMPGMDGYEATRKIRQFNESVIIIAQTAFGKVGDIEVAVKAGCNDYISKPIDLNLLNRLIEKYFIV